MRDMQKVKNISKLYFLPQKNQHKTTKILKISVKTAKNLHLHVCIKYSVNWKWKYLFSFNWSELNCSSGNGLRHMNNFQKANMTIHQLFYNTMKKYLFCCQSVIKGKVLSFQEPGQSNDLLWGWRVDFQVKEVKTKNRKQYDNIPNSENSVNSLFI